MFLLMLPWLASDRAREYAADVVEALRIAKRPDGTRGISRKEAAMAMGIQESLLSEQLACGKQLSASRIADLPQEFHDALDEIRAERSGAVLLRRDFVDMLHGAAVLGRKAMAKAHLSTINAERKRA